MSSLSKISAFGLAGCLLQGCLSTWIRMEDGTVLAPGRSDFSIALGSVPRTTYDCGQGYVGKDSTGRFACEEWYFRERYQELYYDSASQTYQGGYYTYDGGRNHFDPRVDVDREFHVALNWKLGVLGAFGPFTGMQVGMQTEFATAPVTQEFHVAIGLPGSDSSVAHSLAAGWGVGMWADNSWFLQYAASRRFGICRVFGSLRGTLQPSMTAMDIDKGRFESDRSWDLQAAVGAKVPLGRVAVLPDWIGLGATVDLMHAGYPSLDADDLGQESGMGTAWALAMGWNW